MRRVRSRRSCLRRALPPRSPPCFSFLRVKPGVGEGHSGQVCTSQGREGMAESEKEDRRRGGRREEGGGKASKARRRTTSTPPLVYCMALCRWGEDGDPHVVPIRLPLPPRRRSRVGLLMPEFSSERPRQKNQVTRKTRFDSIERSSLNTLNTSAIYNCNIRVQCVLQYFTLLFHFHIYNTNT